MRDKKSLDDINIFTELSETIKKKTKNKVQLVLKGKSETRKEQDRPRIPYRQDSIRQLLKNDSRRYVSIDRQRDEHIPNVQKVDQLFASTRRFVQMKIVDFRSAGQVVPKEKKAKPMKVTTNPINYYRLLDDEKQKADYRQLMHMKMANGSNMTIM